ncbi:MAG: hypothetical protein HY965_00345 [Ignavibacteriales bacterium]|nr:hypothetical protein [Ignavibacteriales bacterium]
MAKGKGWIFVPLKDFNNAKYDNRKVIAMRHDIDSSLVLARKIAEIEAECGVPATYFILHTAKYFCSDIKKITLNKELIDQLLHMQNSLNHEIGLHLDLMTIEKCYHQAPNNYLKELMHILFSNKIRVTGCSPHGTLLAEVFRKEYGCQKTKPLSDVFANPNEVFDPRAFGLDYLANTLKYDLYFTDVSITNNKRWDLSQIEDSDLEQDGKKIIISTHPIHWSKNIAAYFTKNFFLTVKYTFAYLQHYFNYFASK